MISNPGISLLPTPLMGVAYMLFLILAKQLSIQLSILIGFNYRIKLILSD